MKMKILFTGGGTGGHIYPLIAITREIHRMDAKHAVDLYYVGPKDDFGLVLLSQEDIVIKNIISGKIRRYFSVQNALDVAVKIPLGFLQSIFLLLSLKPKLVFSKGGSGSIAVTSAARVLGIPVFIHESDVVPGLSNQKTAVWAKKIFTSFPNTELLNVKKITVIGNPIRQEILHGDREHARQLFNLTFFKPVLLIVGGSQGAEAINDFVLVSLNNLLRNYEVIHVTGTNNFKETVAEAQTVIERDLNQYYHPVGFLTEDQTRHAYKAADLIISRSGSGSIFEIAAIGKPSILIPLPSAAGNHQSKNAYAYAESGAGIVVEQENLKPNFVMENIELLFSQKNKLADMSASALAFAKPLAAKAVAREILEYFMIS